MSEYDDQSRGKTNAPVDIGKRKMAQELEREIQGLFGIDRGDIERAIDRLYAGEISLHGEGRESLPEHTARAIASLDALSALVGELTLEEKWQEIQMILELVEHYKNRWSSALADGIDQRGDDHE